MRSIEYAVLPEAIGRCPEAIVDSLALRSRGYQALYACDRAWPNASAPPTLTDGEAACLIGIVADLLDDEKPWTELDFILFGRMSRGMIRYIAEGAL